MRFARVVCASSTPGLEIGDVHENHRHAFVLHPRAEPGVDGIKSFRALLKVALRRYGLRAIDARELVA